MKQLLVVGFSILLLVYASRSRSQEHDHAHAAEQEADVQHQAAEAMSHSAGHRHDPHMKMTSPRRVTGDDTRRADAVLQQVKQTLERYKDYRNAIEDGYRPFLEHLPLPEHHFTNYGYGFVAAFAFDARKPTSLLYKRRPVRLAPLAQGKSQDYELVGAMYTAPKSFTEDQLHARIPLSVASWHAHVNICLPPSNARSPNWSRFGPKGSIASEAACREAEGRWYPQLFGWMVHVYPFEKEPERIWTH